MSAKKKLSFEDSLQRLEEITGELESPEISLEGSIELYTEGLKLAQECQKKLGKAEQKIKVITEKSGGLIEEEFDTGGIEE